MSYKAFHTDTVSTQYISHYIFTAIKKNSLYLCFSLFGAQNALWQSVKLFPDAAVPLVLDGEGLSHHSHSSCVDVLCLQTSTQCSRQKWRDRCLHFNFHSTRVPWKKQRQTHKKNNGEKKRNLKLLWQKQKTKKQTGEKTKLQIKKKNCKITKWERIITLWEMIEIN